MVFAGSRMRLVLAGPRTGPVPAGSGARRLSLAGLLVSLCFMQFACDGVPSAEDPYARPPNLSGLEYSPQAVQIENLPSAGETVDVSVSVRAAASDVDGDLAGVFFVIQSPVGATEPIAHGELARQGGTYAVEATVPFPKAITGPYVLIVYAADQGGRLSNELRGTIELGASSNPPVIDAIDMPDRVQRPASGEPPVIVQFVATVSDPDGLANVARVQVRFDGGTALLLCDDGGQGSCNPGFASGDATAGDGRFTLTIQVDSGNSPGPRSLQFIATDRSGLESEPITRVFTIE